MNADGNEDLLGARSKTLEHFLKTILGAHLPNIVSEAERALGTPENQAVITQLCSGGSTAKLQIVESLDCYASELALLIEASSTGVSGNLELARNWSGSDGYGIIQFVTTAIFFGVLFLQIANFNELRRERASLVRVRNLLNATSEDGGSARSGILRKIKSGAEVSAAERLVVLSSAGHSSEPLLDRLRTDGAWKLQFIGGFKELLFLSGFIGTVIGIAIAIGNAGKVVGGDEATRQMMIEQLTTQLKIAFDTTIISLVWLGPMLIVSFSLAIYGKETRRRLEAFAARLENRIDN
jgi:hypothetical protein